MERTDEQSQLRAVRLLLAGSAERVKRCREELTQAQERLKGATDEDAALRALEQRLTAALPYESDLKQRVEAVLKKNGRPLRIVDVNKQLAADDYHSIRAVLQRGWRSGAYIREGHLYRLAEHNGLPVDGSNNGGPEGR